MSVDSLKLIENSQNNAISDFKIKINELNNLLDKNQKLISSINNDNQSVYKNILLPDDQLIPSYE